jgi:endo-1,4-beta-xylanase
LTRRSFLLGAAGATALGIASCSGPGRVVRSAPAKAASGKPSPVDCPALDAAGGSRNPLWQTALQRGLVYGSSTATWQISDKGYASLFAREAAILFTEDDLLWYRLRPKPTSDLDFRFGDKIVGFARKNGMLVFGAHLVWDDGFGKGWTRNDLFGMGEKTARQVLFGTLDDVVKRYRGSVVAWSVVNEAINSSGVRHDVPWFQTIGPSYIAESFHRARDADPDAILVLNEYGFETDDAYGIETAVDRRAAVLKLLDQLLHQKVPVDALGVQAHLDVSVFDGFDPRGYRRFLNDVAGHGVKVFVTEMDVLDDTLPEATGPRDRVVADVYRRYLDAALEEPAVVSLMTFGLSDRYTWLQEDFPRDDGAPRRPLPFDDKLHPKPAFRALQGALEGAPPRNVFRVPPRC